MSEPDINYRNRYLRERKARLEAERLLEEKSDELYESLMQVKASEGLLQSAMDSMADGLLLLSQHNEVVLANEQLTQIYPHRRGIFSKGVDLQDRFPELLGHPEYLLATKAEFSESGFTINLSDDRTILVSVRKTREGLISTTHRDITRLKKNEEERQRLLVELLKSQRLQAIGRMSSMIAHDFNNIIASIRGYATFLEEDLAGSEKLVSYARKILAASSNAGELINRINQSNEEKKQPPQRVSLIPVLEDCIDMAGATLSGAVELSMASPDEPVWILTGENRLRQMFTNLFINSQKAIGDGGGWIKINVSRHRDYDLDSLPRTIPHLDVAAESRTLSGLTKHNGPCVSVSVVDCGRGIDPENIRHIFEMYFTTRNSGSGRGLGLASVLETLEDYQGGILVQSRENHGTQVVVIFPETGADRRPELQGSGEFSEEAAESHAQVMIIDDDQDVGAMLEQMIHRAGYTAEYFSSSREACDSLLSEPDKWQVVICDQIMPDLKGTDIYRILRENEIMLPFILCSGKIDPQSSELGDALPEIVVSKPVDRDRLIGHIRYFVSTQYMENKARDGAGK